MNSSSLSLSPTSVHPCIALFPTSPPTHRLPLSAAYSTFSAVRGSVQWGQQHQAKDRRGAGWRGFKQEGERERSTICLLGAHYISFICSLWQGCTKSSPPWSRIKTTNPYLMRAGETFGGFSPSPNGEQRIPVCSGLMCRKLKCEDLSCWY